VTKFFPDPDGAGQVCVFRDVAFGVERGEFLTMVGHSGCGKSTLLNIIAGLETASVGGVVLEGRDTGSVVCPDAEVKVYLDADLAERARRRRDELAARGLPADYESVKTEVALRDRQDMERELAPLRKPPGAVTVDSTALSPEAVVSRILDAVEQARCCTRS